MIDRRDMLAASLSGLALAALPRRGAAAPATRTPTQIIADFTGGATLAETGVTLSLPALAENGFSVPVTIEAPGAAEILLIAPENPFPLIAGFRFGPLSGAQSVSTRIRLARSQQVIAIARLADGSFARALTPVEVTVGGCAG